MANLGNPPIRDRVVDENGNITTVWEKWASTVSTLKIEKVTAVASPNATDLATAITLANELKTVVNTLITALQQAGLSKS